jgi:hypothetical protein
MEGLQGIQSFLDWTSPEVCHKCIRDLQAQHDSDTGVSLGANNQIGVGQNASTHTMVLQQNPSVTTNAQADCRIGT